MRRIVFFLVFYIALLGWVSAQDTNTETDLNTVFDTNAIPNEADVNIQQVIEIADNTFQTAEQIAAKSGIQIDKIAILLIDGGLAFISFISSSTDAMIYMVIMSIAFWWVLGKIPFASKKVFRWPLALFLAFSTVSIFGGIILPIIRSFLSGG